MTKEILDLIFRAYDIRGKIGTELSEEFFFNLGKAYVTHFKPNKVVVGNDMRDTSLVTRRPLLKVYFKRDVTLLILGRLLRR